MKKILSVKLLKDLPGVKAGTEGKFTNTTIPSYSFFNPENKSFVEFRLDIIQSHPDWFEVSYEEEENIIFQFTIYKNGLPWNVRKSQYLKSMDQAIEASCFLESQLNDWLKGRCKKCGSELKMYDDNGTEVVPGKIYYYSSTGSTMRIFSKKCHSCGEVANE